MTDDEKSKRSRGVAPVPLESTPPARKGIVDSSLTGFGAAVRKRAFRQQADELKALAEFHEARGELAASYIQAERSFDQLGELDEIIKTDRLIRTEERAAALADAERRRLDAQNFKAYIEQTGQKSINIRSREKDIKHAERDAEYAEWKEVQEPGKEATPPDPLAMALQRVEVEIESRRARGEDVNDLLRERAELQTMIARRQGKE